MTEDIDRLGSRRLRVKLFEVRNHKTAMLIPVMAVRLLSAGPKEDFEGGVDRQTERWILRRAGLPMDAISGKPDSAPMVLLVDLLGGQSQYSPYRWTNPVMQSIHHLIISKWSDLSSGDVVDVNLERDTVRPTVPTVTTDN
jgi:hypothetical protein